MILYSRQDVQEQSIGSYDVALVQVQHTSLAWRLSFNVTMGSVYQLGGSVMERKTA